MNNQKGFVNIAFIVLVVIIIGAGGYFAFIKKTEPTNQPMQTPQTPTPSAAQTQNDNSQITAQDKTSSWNKYTNIKYGIKFKYPPSLTLTERERTHSTGDSFEISFRQKNDLTLVVVVYLKNPTGDIDQSLNYIKTNYKDIRKTMINGYPALRYFNGNNVIIFSGQKSYSFGNNFKGDGKPLSVADFELLLSSVTIN